MYVQSKIILILTQLGKSLIKILQTSYLDQPFIFILCLLVWICQHAGVTISPETQINGIKIPRTRVPYSRHYNPWFLYFLPHFSLRFIL